jgi:hypothetical protein
MARFLVHLDYASGGRPPALSDSRVVARGGGVMGWLVSVVDCVRTYLGVLVPRLAGKTRSS